VVKKNGLTVGKAAMRWLKHHSELKQNLGDAIIVGASSVKHLEDDLLDLEKDPLPQDVMEAVEKTWPMVKDVALKYWH
jgi:aflatoxin B1 aldehyde reductase